MGSYRVFISYSHEDYELVEKLVSILEENGLTPMWDRDFAWGHGFPEQIKNFIAHAHVFVPVITEASSKRGWVHQEIGYAMALNVPILPVTLDRVPGEMLQQLLAVSWSDDLEILKPKLSFRTFANLVRHAQGNSRPLFECAELQEDRTMMMVEYATKVLELGYHGHVRQKGALSSFHIPDKPVSNPVWYQRYGSIEPSLFRCKLLRDERRLLGEHARESGCSLIVNPYLSYEKYGSQARMVRLRTLLEFLESMPDDMVRVAMSKRTPEGQSVTVVGDWFAAESVSASIGKGYRQTIFTRHAPTVQSMLELFDQELEDLIHEQEHMTGSSRDAAVATLRRMLVELEESSYDGSGRAVPTVRTSVQPTGCRR